MSYKTGTNNRVALGGQARARLLASTRVVASAAPLRCLLASPAHPSAPAAVRVPRAKLLIPRTCIAARQQLVYDTGTEPP